MQEYNLILDGDVQDVLRGKQNDALAAARSQLGWRTGLDGEYSSAEQRFIIRLRLLQLRSHLFPRLRQANWLDGLEHIIDSICIKGADGILVVSRSKDDIRRFGELRQEIESAQARHFDVEQDHIGPGIAKDLKRIQAIGSLAYNLNVRVCRQETH